MNAALLLLLTLLFQSGDRASIEGVVIRAGTTEGVADARILLTKVDGRLADSVVAVVDDRGKFEVRNIPPGTYRVFSAHDDYVRAEHTAPVTLAARQQIRNITLAMIPTGIITGRVVNQDNEPVSRIYIRATDDQKVVHETQTNDLGEYRIYGLAPGMYTIIAARYTAPRIDGPSYIVPGPPRLDSLGEGQAVNTLANITKSGGFIDPRALNGENSPTVTYPGVIDLQPGAVLRGIDLRF